LNTTLKQNIDLLLEYYKNKGYLKCGYNISKILPENLESTKGIFTNNSRGCFCIKEPDEYTITFYKFKSGYTNCVPRYDFDYGTECCELYTCQSYKDFESVGSYSIYDFLYEMQFDHLEDVCGGTHPIFVKRTISIEEELKKYNIKPILSNTAQDNSKKSSNFSNSIVNIEFTGDFYKDTGTGDFPQSVSGDFNAKITYNLNCSNTFLHIGVVSGDVNTGFDISKYCGDDYKVISFIGSADITYKIKGKFLTDLIYGKYKLITDTNFSSEGFKYLDLFICTNGPDTIKFNGQIVKQINKKGIYACYNLPLKDNNFIESNSKILGVLHYGKFDLDSNLIETQPTKKYCEATCANWLQNELKGL
jgi:hypothetical protein